jgi:hypothetical protein
MSARVYDEAQAACGESGGNLVMYESASEQLLVENHFFFAGGAQARQARQAQQGGRALGLRPHDDDCWHVVAVGSGRERQGAGSTQADEPM